MCLGNLDILLLGSYYPSQDKLKKMYTDGEPSLNKKLKDNKPLHYMEKLNHLKKELAKSGHSAYLVRDKKTEIKNVWKRTIALMNESQLIIHLLTNRGGSLLEHAILTCLDLHYKTYTFASRKEMKILTGLITKGTRLMPKVQLYIYETDKELFDLIERNIDDFQRESFVKELKNKLETNQ